MTSELDEEDQKPALKKAKPNGQAKVQTTGGSKAKVSRVADRHQIELQQSLTLVTFQCSDCNQESGPQGRQGISKDQVFRCNIIQQQGLYYSGTEKDDQAGEWSSQAINHLMIYVGLVRSLPFRLCSLSLDRRRRKVNSTVYPRLFIHLYRTPSASQTEHSILATQPCGTCP